MRALVLMVLLLPQLALGAPPDVREQHRQAQEQLIAGETDAALALVEQGLALAPLDLDLLLLRGHVLLKQTDYTGALAAYRKYLASGAKGKNRREVVRIVASLEQASTTFLQVMVKNGPGEVRVDTRTGKPFCVADPGCKRGIVPGDHLVVVDRAGHLRASKRIEVPPGVTTVLEVTLAARTSPLTVRTDPVEATVVVDGAAAPAELAPGRHTIEVSSPGYFPERETVDAGDGRPVVVDITLRQGVPISVTPANATLTVDGKAVEITDGLIPFGRVVAAKAAGYATASVTLERPGQPVTLVLQPLGATVQVSDAPRGAKLFVDGTARPLSGPLAVSPGAHTVEVRVPGKNRFRQQLEVQAGNAAVVYMEPGSTSRPMAVIASLVGVAGLGLGTYFGVVALDKMKDYDVRAPQAGISRNESAQKALEEDGNRFALLADVSFGVGMVALAASVVFFRIEGRDLAGRVEMKLLPGAVELSGRF